MQLNDDWQRKGARPQVGARRAANKGLGEPAGGAAAVWRPGCTMAIQALPCCTALPQRGSLATRAWWAMPPLWTKRQPSRAIR